MFSNWDIFDHWAPPRDAQTTLIWPAPIYSM